MSMEREFESINTELDIPGSLNIGPEMLKDVHEMDRGEPLTWGATPLDPHRKDVAEQQRSVNRTLSGLFPKSPEEVPLGLNWATAQFIHDNYDMRTHHRVSRNYDSYQSRGKFDISEVPLEAIGVVERSITGHASPAEIMVTAEIQEIPTVELGSLSHLYGGERIKKYLAPMRKAIEESVLFMGGQLVEPNQEYKVKRASYFNGDYKDADPSILMTRTRRIGVIGEDITIVERSSFNVVLSRLNSEIDEKIRNIEYSEHEWSKDIIAIPGFKEAVDKALQDDRHDIAVPISTTSFEINTRLVKSLLENKKHIEARQREIAMRALRASGEFIIL